MGMGRCVACGALFSKFRNIKAKMNGHAFDSLKERDRYLRLKLMERTGEISSLCVHPKYEIVVNRIKICSFTPDFSYHQNGQKVVEDVKGMGRVQNSVVVGGSKRRRFTTRTAAYALKKRLMLAVHGIEIREI